MVPNSFDDLRPSFLLNLRARGSAEELLSIWYDQIIHHYSDAKITLPTDRLPAVSALAKHFADELCSPYLAGLWLEGLWYGLSWFRRGSQSTERPKNYIAPSWSWASINAGVDWHIFAPGTLEKKRVEILDAVVDPVGDAFGQVSHGWVKLTGPLVENISPLTNGPTAFLDRIDPDYPLEHPPEKVHCLLLGESPLNVRSYFLLLVISSKNSNVYERYGMGSKWSRTSEQWQEKTITII
jgi:hypothetical protein